MARTREMLLLPLLACLALLGCSDAAMDDKYRVNLRVFYRAFCPACQWFVGDPLLELVRNEQFRNIVNLKLIPAAGMSDHDGQLNCEGGPLECTGHKWQACVIDQYKSDVVKYLGTIACIEGSESGHAGDWDTKVRNCLTPEQLQEVRSCFESKSESLLRDYIKKDESGNVQWMPYTIVEQKVLGSATQAVSLQELQTNVCSSYKGPKKYYPEVCESLSGAQTQFAPDDGEQLAPKVPGKTVDTKTDEEEFESAVKEEVKESGKVRLDVFWRAFCPGCMAFISKPLLRLLSDEQFQDIIDFRPVPAAGTYFDSSGNFVCNKGLVECIGHKWLSCVIEEFPKLGEMAEHLACLESKENKGVTWDFIINKCFSGSAHTKMQKCFDNKSVDLLKKHIAQRDKLELQWVPYVLVNGATIGDARHGISYKMLTEEVCKAYSGSVELRPLACQPKRLRNDDTTDVAKESEEPAIKPCPPKKTGTTGPVSYQDAPGMGMRKQLDTDVGEQGVKLNAGAAETGSSSPARSLVLPIICFVVVGGIAMRLSGGHKKDA
ncbi:TPA: hypothetical protein N0F65_008067 [Lagenidium giganteum]|uniref:Gamma-interferon-inducible lysosomal thiol reductase n=1 Tax=Lagenidium giganteum TaxID=4803 RepID=A0AAV2YSX6_9STRA|nr:TPA: hypothetical protein N0F65_008067 [Lagenidium giganteum]